MGNRVILATIIVVVALMLFASAVVPAMAKQGGQKGPPEAVCLDLRDILVAAGLTNDKIIAILQANGCL